MITETLPISVAVDGRFQRMAYRKGVNFLPRLRQLLDWLVFLKGSLTRVCFSQKSLIFSPIKRMRERNLYFKKWK